MTRSFEHLVVGKGMIGAAALRHLSRQAERVAVLGPDEPRRAGTHEGVFASHYDQGRVATQLSRDDTWAVLTRLSMAEYTALEEAGGRRFYDPVGMVFAMPAGDPRLQAVADRACRLGVNHVRLASPESDRRLRALRVPPGFEILVEEAPAGIINPRSMIQNQLTVARRQGAHICRDTVIAAERASSGWRLTTDRGDRYTAEQVLLSVGAYINCFGFWHRDLAVRVKSETTILAGVPPAEAARLRGLPPVSYEIEAPSISGVYLVPPLRDPDGNDYLKLGANTDTDRTLSTLGEIQEWMQSGTNQPRTDLLEALHALIPNLRVRSVRVKRCLVTYSEHGKPYVDHLGDGMFVATAGCGSSAACSDALGHLAADLMLGRPWPADLVRGDFEPRFAASRADRSPARVAAGEAR